MIGVSVLLVDPLAYRAGMHVVRSAFVFLFASILACSTVDAVQGVP